MIAVKYCNDIYYDNKMFSKIGGVSLQQINRLEKEFLYLISYNLYFQEEAFLEYYYRIASMKFSHKWENEYFKIYFTILSKIIFPYYYAFW